jgi:hypothetical protein
MMSHIDEAMGSIYQQKKSKTKMRALAGTRTRDKRGLLGGGMHANHYAIRAR